MNRTTLPTPPLPSLPRVIPPISGVIDAEANLVDGQTVIEITALYGHRFLFQMPPALGLLLGETLIAISERAAGRGALCAVGAVERGGAV